MLIDTFDSFIERKKENPGMDSPICFMYLIVHFALMAIFQFCITADSSNRTNIILNYSCTTVGQPFSQFCKNSSLYTGSSCDKVSQPLSTADNTIFFAETE